MKDTVVKDKIGGNASLLTNLVKQSPFGPTVQTAFLDFRGSYT